MGGKSSAPAAPDPVATANAQNQYNKDTANYNAQLSRYNVDTPFGSQTWTQGDPVRTFNQQRYDDAVKAAQGQSVFQGGGDASDGTWIRTGGGPTPDRNDEQFYDMLPSTNWSQKISLTPSAQTALENSQKTQAGLSALQGQALGGVASMLNSNPFDRSQLPARQINAGQTAQDAIMSRLQPAMDLENKNFEADMANRGIAQGSDAYNAAKRSMTNAQNDRLIQAASTGIQVGNDARNQAIQEQMTYANAPLNYLSGLMSGSQVQTPQFQSTAPVSAGTPNYQQAVQNNYQGQLNAYNAETGSDNSMTTGLMSIGSAAIMAF